MDNHTPLVAIYRFYDEFISGIATACRRGCSACCTVNVAVTGLEANYVKKALDKTHTDEIIATPTQSASSPRYTPSTTLNRNTWQIIRGEEVTEDSGTHEDGTCPLLDDAGLCMVYENRPFACRAMSSSTPCHKGGTAEMDPFLITINLALYQVIEHLDSMGGITGNISDLLYLQPTSNSDSGPECLEDACGSRTIRNCALPGFIIPPEDKIRFRSFLRRLRAYPAENGKLGHWLPEDIAVY